MSFLGKGKKVLMRGIVLSGGAPKSAFQYLDILKKDGCDITVIAQESEQKLKEMYEKTFDKLILTEDLLSYHKSHNFKGLYQRLKLEYRDLKNNKPDLVILLGHFNALFYAPFCNSLGIPNITLIAGGDLSKGSMLLHKCPTDHVICFSQENKDVLLNHFEDSRITVIPNRIKLQESFNDYDSHYNFGDGDVVRILLTSRISVDKFDSIINFIKTMEQVATGGVKISLTIAGGGDLLNELKNYASAINNLNLEIVIKGHVDNLISEFRKAHIVVGKGRSVIEPIMMNRVGCVIGNDGKIEICTRDNFERLYHYNFSGRNLVNDNSVALMKTLIDSLKNSQYDLSEIKKISELVSHYYSAEYLKDNFYDVLNSMVLRKTKRKHISVLFQIIKLLLYKVKQRKVNKLNQNGKC